MERLCAHCGNPVKGRSDKKFCDDFCRSASHQKRQDTATALIRTTNSILKRNREILRELKPTGKVTVRVQELTDRGFNFDYHTSTYETAKGNRYRYCYDMGYLVLDGGRVLLIIREGPTRK